MDKNVPKLRFKGFEGIWKEKKLEELGVFLKGNGISKSELTEQGQKCILYGELYTTYNEVIGLVKSRTEVELKNPVYSKKNDLIIPSSGETAKDIATASCVQNNNILLGGDLNIFRAKTDNGIFLSYQLNGVRHKEISKLAQGKSVVHLYNEQLKKIKVKFPEEKEQEKIASFFLKVDNLIEEKVEKVDDLELYKKGMMQKIFSQKIRFKDKNGYNYPIWSKKVLGDILIEDLYPVKKPQKPYLKLSVKSHAKGTFSSLVEKPEEVMMETLYEVKVNQLIVNITFAWEHAIAIVKKCDENKLVSHRFPTYRFNEMSYYKFYEYVIKQKRMKYDLGIASPGGAGRNRVLNKREFLQIEVINPSLNEQIKIGNFLFKIDNIIEEEKKNLNNLKEWKKGLLQHMFI